MFNWNKDKGEQRSFGYRDEFVAGPAGELHRTGATAQSAQICATIAATYRAVAADLEAEAAEFRHEADRVVEGHVLHTMVSGG